jgi:hypothetical protein
MMKSPKPAVVDRLVHSESTQKLSGLEQLTWRLSS